MVSFGEQLQREREARGMSLSEVAAVTRIPVRYLRALEANDFSDLPGEVFARGYVRACANCLGADAAPLIKAYEHERGIAPADQSPIVDALPIRGAAGAERRRTRPRRRWMVVAGVIGLAGASAAVVVATRTPPDRAREPERSEPRTIVKSSASDDRPAEAAPAVAKDADDGPAKDDTPATTDGPERLSVPEFHLSAGTKVAESEASFGEGTRVWFHTRVVGGRRGDRIEHVWLRGGRAVQTIALRVNGSNWLTKSFKTLGAGTADAWAVEARDPAGRVLARKTFVCQPKAQPGALAEPGEEPTRLGED